MKNIRVRFAPSPTGPLHIGNLRTALFNYLFAKKKKGSFIIRFEDTDKERYIKASEKHILNSLKWCGIQADEGPDNGNYGPYRQSKRKHIYKKYVKYLLKKNYAYYAFESKDELKQIRTEYKDKGKLFIYNYSTRKNLKNSFNNCYYNQIKKKQTKYIIRLNVPVSKTIKVYDLLRGNISINSNVIDDKVLVKSDGNVTYHLANVIDDHLMKITHVIKGEEWISSFPILHVLYYYFNWKMPKFIHLPLILNSFGKGKLSKRNYNKLNIPIFPLKWKDPIKLKTILGYRELGYFPDALLNMLALFGWNPGCEQEIFSLKELIATFSLKDINFSSARFDKQKIDWINHRHLQSRSIDELTRLVKLCLNEQKIYFNNDKTIKQIILRIRSQCTFVYQIIEKAIYFFKKPTLKKNYIKKQIINIKITKKILFLIIEWFNNYDKNNLKLLRLFLAKLAFKKNIKIHYFLKLLRLSLVGKLVGLEILFIITKLKTQDIIKRICNVILLLN
ncbi:glutamate--tRNA ligase [Candidatus Karelsulcia muelleri]|uniref:glutamate--tRNA ligase n=1 Tax=Candidatus Karelsulcia muelleri TaxID=336810 RepID=UPI002363CC55|nr:glutamate--tRNA ligase [Candidatus Karelsulcia muelleri]WDE42156.1 glutamate--tRNA ligase [Candidatus Karelsulcia muelleri]WDR79145.1 glutamate--tRNA ligase [Candidatus Karelsulcia muelleri]